MGQPASEPVPTPAAAPAAALRALTALSDAVLRTWARRSLQRTPGAGYGAMPGTVTRGSSRLGSACALQAQPSRVTERGAHLFHCGVAALRGSSALPCAFLVCFEPCLLALCSCFHFRFGLSLCVP